MLYAVYVSIHVLASILAVGLVGAVPLTARIARRSGGDLAVFARILRALLLVMQVGLLIMLLSGVLLDLSVAGVFHRTGWFKVSMVAVVLLGASIGRARVALRRGFAAGGVPENAMGQLERWGAAMFALVAVIAFLMQMKPWS